MPVILNNKYELGRKLGEGVSCKVKLARDSSGTRFAIKLMRPGQDFEECVENELRVLKDLQHQNIVNLVEVGEGQQVHPRKGTKVVKYIVLELVGGGELFDLVALGGRLSEAQGRFYFRQLLDGLAYMHSNGYTHRDIKPENILLDNNFVLKISDFGFSTNIKGKKGDGLISTLLGTQSYMAPEIHMGVHYEGATVDLFASAIVLFTILCQRPPFRVAKPNDPHYSLLAKGENDIFWEAHAEANGGDDIFSADFKDMFQQIMKLDPKKRLTIEQINQHAWMQGSMPSQDEIFQDFTIRKEVVEAEAKKERDAKRAKREAVKAKVSARVKRSGAEKFDDGAAAVQDDENNTWLNLEVQEYGDTYHLSETQFFSTYEPLELFVSFIDYLDDKEAQYRISGSKMQVQYVFQIGSDNEAKAKQVLVTAQVLKVGEDKSCMLFSFQDGDSRTKISNNLTTEHYCAVLSEEGMKCLCDANFSADD